MKRRQQQTVFRNPLARLMPMPAEVRNRLVLRAYTALDSLTSGSDGNDVEAWRDLADVVNVTETLCVQLKALDARALEYTAQANDSMKAAQARYKNGAPLLLYESGIYALRMVLMLYEQCLKLLSERVVEEAFMRTAQEVRRLIASGVEAVAL